MPRPAVGGTLEETTGSAVVPVVPVETKPKIVLPTEPRKVESQLSNLVTFIYGPPKIGKSTLASEFGRVLFFELEPGLNGLEVMTTGPITTWTEFCDWVTAVREDNGKTYDAFCIDTVDILAERCSEHTNSRQGIMHESDLDFGKGWSVAKKELTRWVNKLAAVPDTGLILISHAHEVEIKTRNSSYNKTVPTLSKSARNLFLGMADVILFCDYAYSDNETERVLHGQPSRYWDAGDRFNRLPESIEWLPGRGYEALTAAWKGGSR